MVYDITNPNEVSYVNYINSRDFSDTLGKDDSPEGLKFISAEQSPTGQALLLAACEVGGTVAVYDLVSGEKKPSEGETDPPSTEEDPEKPSEEDPENPSEEDGNRPDEEETTKQPSEAETAEPEETEKNPEQNPNTGGSAPNTGDEQNVGIWIVWMGLAGAGMVIGSRKKQSRT